MNFLPLYQKEYFTKYNLLIINKLKNTKNNSQNLCFRETLFQQALSNIIIGSNTTDGSNNVVIGNGTTFNGFSNAIYLGNANTQAAACRVSWTSYSDKRLKSNIQNSNLGLDFISKLRPVSYYRNNDENKKTEYGLIAQELEETLNSAGVTNNGIISKDGEGMYSVRYNDLIAPMIKAIQEQKTIIDNQQTQIDELKKMVESMLKK